MDKDKELELNKWYSGKFIQYRDEKTGELKMEVHWTEVSDDKDNVTNTK